MSELCGCAYHPIKARRWAHCRRCGRTPDQGAVISSRGRCMDCGIGQSVRTIRDLAAKTGPQWDSYIEGMTRYARTLVGKPS